MRIASLIVIAAAFAVSAIIPADAATSKKKRYENREHYSITVRKPRSYLDAGTEVRPGEKSYHDYYSLLTPRYPTYGPVNDSRDYRWPLPSRFELPGY
jgi:hypothetical protein